MDDSRARHIGDIIRERHNCAAHGQAAVARPKLNLFSRVRKILRLVFGRVFDLLATIGWFVTRPFIADDDRPLTSRAQIRG
jgi:hypothetical protein